MLGERARYLFVSLFVFPREYILLLSSKCNRKHQSANVE